MPEQINSPEVNPFDNLEPDNPFDNLTPPLSGVREPLVDQLRSDPSLLTNLFSLTHREVGGQGEEAQQAFMETVFNRAAARGKPIADVVTDPSYYPQASRTPASLSDDDVTRYGKILSDVAGGSNISNFATGNASGDVGFAGGPQTFEAGGERYGIEGPDLPKVQAFIQANPEASQLTQATGESNPFDDLSPAKPEPLPTPEVAQEEPNWASKTEEALRQYVSNMVPHSAEEVARSFNVPTDWSNPLSVAEFVAPPLQVAHQFVAQGINRMRQIQAAEKTPPFSQERFSAGIGTALDMANLASMLKGASLVATIPAVPLPKGQSLPIGGVKGSGKFRAAYQIDKELGDMLEGIGASYESGAFRAETHLRNLTADLNPTQEADLGKYLVSRRLNTLNSQHAQLLSPAEMARIESDPQIAHALNYYRNEIKPEIESWRKRAGLSEEAAAGKEAEFISLIPKEEPIPKQYGKTQQASRLARKTRFAQKAEGQAKEYHTSISDIVRESYADVIKKARVSDFYKAAHAKGLAMKSTIITPAGPKQAIMFEGLDPELQPQLRAATERPPPQSGLIKGVRAVQRGATSVALTTNPAELTNHMRRQLHIVAAKPPVGRGLLARLEWLLPYIGPKSGAFIRSVVDDMSNPENVAVLRDVIDAGGGSSRSFSNLYAWRGGLAKWTGLKWLQSKTHKLLFGLPKGRGVGGWDLRMRVQLEKIRRAAEPWAANDPQRMREFANQIGQYGQHPDWIISALKELNPYAATTLPLRLTELKTMAGVSGLQSGNLAMRAFRVAETQLRGTGGTILALTAANKLLSGRWPWENDPGHEFDLATGLLGKDGRRIYLKLRVIGPELSRPLQTVAIPNLLRERTAEKPQYLAALAAALGNQGLAIVGGPAQNALMTVTTGKVPYLVKQPGKAADFMDVAKTEKGQSRGLEQLKRAGASLNPLGESMLPPRYEPSLPPILEILERPIGGFRGVRPFGSMFTESYEKKPSKPQTAAQRAATIRRKIKKGT